MSYKGHPGKLTNADVVDLLNRGIYTVDISTGEVRHHEKGLKTVRRKRGRGEVKYPSIRLFADKKHIEIGLHELIWMAATRYPFDRDFFEVHHRDTDITNVNFRNLYLLFKVDHRKLHNGTKYEDLIQPF